VPKSKKPNDSVAEKKTAWRTPVKLPSIASEPMKSLYSSNSDTAVEQAKPQAKEIMSEPESFISAQENSAQDTNQSPKVLDSSLADYVSKTKTTLPIAVSKRESRREPPTASGRQTKTEDKPENFTETEFLRLLKTEKMDFYSLAEILRGSSMALYCVLYSESLAKGENRCQLRQNELMMRAGINNPATLYKQERWLTTLRLISKSVRLGNHSGASYEVRPLETLPLPAHILDQFDSYLAELI
jgi:hypothetical protein